MPEYKQYVIEFKLYDGTIRKVPIEIPMGEKGDDGGYYTPAITQPSETKLQFAFTPSKSNMPAVQPVQVTLPAGTGSGGNADQNDSNGLSSTEKTLMLSLFKNSIFATDMTSTIAQLEAYWNGSGGSGDSGGNEGGGDTGGDSGDEPGGGTPPVVEALPSWIAEMQVIEFTPEADTNEVQTFAINMDEEPNMVFVKSDIEERISTRDFVSGMYLKDPIWGKVGHISNTTNSVGFESSSGSTSDVSISANAVTINTPTVGNTNCYWRAGHTYKVYCIKTACDSTDMTTVPSFAKEVYATAFTPEAKTNEVQTFTYEMDNEPNAVLILTNYTENGEYLDFYGALIVKSLDDMWRNLEIRRKTSDILVTQSVTGYGVKSCTDGSLVYQTSVVGGTGLYWLPDRTYHIIFMHI